MDKGLEKLRLFTTSAHPALMEKIAENLGIEHGRYVTLDFANHNSLPQLLTEVEGCKIFIIHTFAPTPSVETEFAEFKKLIRAAKEYGAQEVIAIIGYYSYGRSHRKKPWGAPLAAKLYAEEVRNAGVDQVIMMVLHNLEILKYFGIPVIHLATKHLVIKALGRFVNAENATLLTPDEGGKERIESFSRDMGLPVAYGKKERTGDGEVKFFGIEGEIKEVLICIDDEVSTASTIEDIFLYCLTSFPQLREIIFVATHGVLCGAAIKKLSRVWEMAKDKGINFEILLEDTLPIPATKRLPNMKIISVTPMLADVIRAIHLEKNIDPKYLY